MSGKPFLQASGLHTFYGPSHILHGINLTVHEGEAISLMGRNGMGKTTTIRSIFGLTPPREGTVMIDGANSAGYPPQNLARRGLALVPEGRGIFPNLSVRENLVMSARPGPDGQMDWTFNRIMELFPRLSERLGNMGNQLSGGEQQMLSIGRALMTNPRLLVLDEATEGLAPLIRKEIWSVIRTIKEAGVATLLVDKDVKSLLSVCDRCVIIEKGCVVYDNTASHMADHPDIHVRYLGV